ncbi:hypothetical protein ACH5RR_008543 [Cinchona calisaya]|uniref:Glutathione S-transferase n=1 Tax=Cinchona calisaya TaxID=153742 RepID=A0ABD3ABR9_9GENT
MAVDEVKLIGTPGSIFCSRIEWALTLKGVKYEYIEENLLNKSPLLLKSNPIYKKVPVLMHNGKPIVESLVILEYIDETWKYNPLLPQDPYERSRARFYAKFVDEKCIYGVWGTYSAEGEEKEKAIEAAHELIAIIEKQIEGKKFFNGEQIGYLDLVVGWMTHWLSVMEEIGGMKLLDQDRYPALKKWTEDFIQVPAILESTTAREVVFNYFQGTIDYMRSLAAAKA